MPKYPRRPETGNSRHRWILIRDVIAFQLKLIVDGMRDFVLVPVSIIAGIVSFMKPGDKPGDEFYSLLRLGQKTEHWINLFGAADKSPGWDDPEHPSGDDIDTLINRVENFVVDEYRKGGVTKQARDHLDQFLKSLNGHPGGNRHDDAEEPHEEPYEEPHQE